MQKLFCVFFRPVAQVSISYAIEDGLVQRLLDEADRRILRELQRDSARTVTEIAEAVGLSHAPCWRRIQRLRSEGIIEREAAVLSHSKLGWDLEFFVYLKFSMHGRANVPEFRRKIIQHARVIG